MWYEKEMKTNSNGYAYQCWIDFLKYGFYSKATIVPLRMKISLRILPPALAYGNFYKQWAGGKMQSSVFILNALIMENDTAPHSWINKISNALYERRKPYIFRSPFRQAPSTNSTGCRLFQFHKCGRILS